MEIASEVGIRMYDALNIFSWVVFAVLVGVTLCLLRRDRVQRRRPCSNDAIAGSEIDALERAGKITGEEAQFLKQQVGGVPEDGAKTAVPDFRLRLAAAFTRIGAGTVLIWFLSRALLMAWEYGVSSGWRGNAAGMFHVEFAMPGGIEGFAFLVVAGVGLSVFVIQFFAARAWLVGSPWGRKWVIAGWLVTFLLLPQFFQARFWLPPVGLYVLWVALQETRSRMGRVTVAALALMVLVLGIWNIGVRGNEVRTQLQSGAGYAAGGPTARLERLLVITGTPDPVTAQTAAMLCERLEQAGIPARTVPYDAPAEMIDGDREIAIWLARGVAPGDESHPVYLARTLFGGGGEWWQGLRLPDMQLNFSGTTKILSPGDDGVPARWTKEIAGKLLPLLKRFQGPDALPLPLRTAAPLPPPRDVAVEKDLRHVARVRRGGAGYDLYALTVAAPDDPEVRAAECLTRLGISGRGRVPCYGEAGYFVEPGNLAALLVIPWADTTPRENPDIVWLRREAHDEVKRFVLCGGLQLIPEEERGAVLERFFALPGLGVESRLQTLRNAVSRPGDEKLDTLLRREFLRLADDIIADPAGAGFCSGLEALWLLSGRAPFLGLDSELRTRLGSRCHRLNLADCPVKGGAINAEYEWTVPSLPDSRGVIEIIFPDGICKPVRFWYEVKRLDGGLYTVRNGDSWSEVPSLSAVHDQVSQSTWYADGDDPVPELYSRMWSQRQRDKGLSPGPCEPGEMDTLLFCDVEANRYRLQLAFCPGTAETRRFQRQLRRLDRGTYSDFESEYTAVLRELPASAGTPGFLARLEKMARIGNYGEQRELARRLRREVGAGCFLDAAFPAKPDDDGRYRLHREFPVGTTEVVQLLIELELPGPEPIVLQIPFDTMGDEGGLAIKDENGVMRRLPSVDRRGKQAATLWKPIRYNNRLMGYYPAQSQWLDPSTELFRPSSGEILTVCRLDADRKLLIFDAIGRL